MGICQNCVNCPCNHYPQLNNPIKLIPKPILVIGETVTPIEAKRGQVMTGPAATILKETMEKVGLPVDSTMVNYTVALTCAIPKKKGEKAFPKEALMNCRTRLLEDIRAAQPQMIIVCGKIALETLEGNNKIKITEQYGRARTYPYTGDAIVFPVMNPGLIMRAPKDYKPFLAMLQLASTMFNGDKTYDSGITTWEVLDTKEKCYEGWKKLQDLYAAGKMPYAAYDTETTSLDYREAEFLVMGICYEKNKNMIVPREMKEFVHNFIEGVPWKCVWQHGKYDKKVMWRRKLGNISIDEDVMYMHYVLDETSQHDLGYLSKVFLQAEEYKYKMNQNWKSVDVLSYPKFKEALCERVAVDCDYTFQLVDVLRKQVEKEPKFVALYNNLIIPAANYLSRVEQNGLLIDPFFLGQLDKKYEKILADIKQEIQKLAAPFWDPEQYMIDMSHKTAPAVFNPGAPDQMKWMVYERFKLKPRIRKAKSTDKDILKSIPEVEAYLVTKDKTYEELSIGSKLVAKVLEYRAVQKEKSTYVEGLLNARDNDGRVRTTFNLHVTATGRLSSKEPNVQNQPSAHGVGNIRRAFIPKPGYVFAEIDYSSAELRWLAFLSKCPVLSEVFIEGRNLHKETATALFGPHYTVAQKMRAKAVNFGIPYGREPGSFVDEFNITKQEAAAMISGWLDKYYGARDYLNWCAEQVIAGNYLETPWGRRRRFGLVTPESLHGLQNEAKNFPIQSSSSDLLLYCGIQMEDTLRNEFNTFEDNLIHDSILLEIPAKAEIIAQVGQYANGLMTSMPKKLFDCPIPFKTDFEIGTDWGTVYTFNYNTLKVEEELEDDSIREYDFDEWYDMYCHKDIYEKLNMEVA